MKTSMVQRGVKMPLAVWELLAALAERRGTSQVEVIRSAIRGVAEVEFGPGAYPDPTQALVGNPAFRSAAAKRGTTAPQNDTLDAS